MKLYHIIIFLLIIICTGCQSGVDRQKCASLTAASTGMNRVEAKPIHVQGLPNLYKVSDDIYRSAQPEEGGMISAKSLGIKTILCLREADNDEDIRIDHKEGTNLNLIHLPIATRNVNIQNVIDAMRIIRDAPKPILVHCYHGADRTGLIVAMYRIVYENWPKSCAKSEMMDGDFGFHFIWRNIPKLIDNADIDRIKGELFESVVD